MEYVGRIELATPRIYHTDDLTPPHQTLVDYLDHKPSLLTLRTGLKIITRRKAAVVYHIERNGHPEHPHFLEVPISSSKGLYLKDVINALNSIRGPGMANMYSWSSKRRHGKGFVWKDLTENDLIQPCSNDDGGNDNYILKGSPVPELFSTWNLRSPAADTLTSSATSKGSSDDIDTSSLSDDDDFDSPVIRGKSFGCGTTFVDADVNQHRRDKLPPPRTLTILTNEIDELCSEFPSPMDGDGDVGAAKKVDAEEAYCNHHETLRSAMMRTTTDRVSPSTPAESIARKPAAGRVGRPRTTDLLWTLVRCGRVDHVR
ncbi:unnamed protein product [Linum tenue]|uniref:SOSEKI DIX-like domain-containing protein n=1 Tax=Linum tenue TaxID=586396 RepID=A0AAV0MAJ5_9ROSI|nr:unnamed protein product [Linum tenue]